MSSGTYKWNADLYSLGGLLYYLTFFRHPFDQAKGFNQLYNLKSNLSKLDFHQRKDISKDLITLIKKLMESVPEKREINKISHLWFNKQYKALMKKIEIDVIAESEIKKI